MVDYGNAPFLWLADHPDETGIGGNLCDGSYWDATFPMSESLWRKFADWAIEFDRTAFYSDSFDANHWDWIDFHARGLKMARCLKDEVRDAYRVIYEKPYEDPNCIIDERREILADGAIALLPSRRGRFQEPFRFCQRIVSGGQTGADRAALDFAIKHGYPHGGWCPKGRRAVDGPLSLKYQLRETDSTGYRQRTKLNVRDCDATLICNLGALDGGTLQTALFADQMDKPYLVIQLDQGSEVAAAAKVLKWLRTGCFGSLNVAGPREEKRPGIYALTLSLLDRCTAFTEEKS